MVKNKNIIILGLVILISSCGKSGHQSGQENHLVNALPTSDDNVLVASRFTTSKASDGLYISWKEHLIDGPEISGVPLVEAMD